MSDAINTDKEWFILAAGFSTLCAAFGIGIGHFAPWLVGLAFRDVIGLSVDTSVALTVGNYVVVGIGLIAAADYYARRTEPPVTTAAESRGAEDSTGSAGSEKPQDTYDS